MADENGIRITHAIVDEFNGQVVVRGILTPESLQKLKVDDYQREVLPVTKVADFIEACVKGEVPDIDLGMRGKDFKERDGVVTLRDEVFIIDGLQRRAAALETIKQKLVPHIGCVVRFETTRQFEQERFRKLNALQVKLSANVKLRNLYMEGSRGVGILHGLTYDSSFPLCRRVNWQQRKKDNDLMSATLLLKAVGALFGLLESEHGALTDKLDALVEEQGEMVIRQNIRLYFDVIEECFGVRKVVSKADAGWLKSSFLRVLGRIVNEHSNFWADSKLIFPTELRKRLKEFPVSSDAYIASLCGSSATGGPAQQLYGMLLKHLNKGDRAHRLKPRVEAIATEFIPAPLRGHRKQTFV